jgi:hypothetical protein
MIYREPGFLAVVWFGSFPVPSPPSPVSKLDRRRTRRLRKRRKRDNLLREGREGVGEEPNHTTARNVILYISFNTLWEQR